jgi:hypothetical protein
MVLVEDLHHVFGLRRLGEGSEPAQVEEDDDDLPAVGFERVIGIAGNNQLNELRREEALEPAESLDLRDLVPDPLLWP